MEQLTQGCEVLRAQAGVGKCLAEADSDSWWLPCGLTPACVGQGCAEAMPVAISLPPSSSLPSLSSPTLLPPLLIYPHLRLSPPSPPLPPFLFSPPLFLPSLSSPFSFLAFLLTRCSLNPLFCLLCQWLLRDPTPSDPIPLCLLVGSMRH